MKLDLRRERRETLLGIGCAVRPLPPTWKGNCVTVGEYHVRNVSAENLNFWVKENGAQEVEVEEVADNVVEIVDERFPDSFLRESCCSICEQQAMLRKKR